ncbi:MAG: hypothetical protein U5L96_02085 [Owenweeksia sp.]|nr:hypothetical protein [Owenweeksia sp.]
MSQAHYLKVEKTTRYYLSGPLEGDYKSVCFALHGYGQLAPDFIRPFTDKRLSSILFIAPEAPHRFYLNGTGGRVGASWMTKEDRLRDIEDYCHYLDSLYQYLNPHLKKIESLGVLGFSQGVATACRWLSYSNISFDFLINYAGIYPPDLPQQEAMEKMQKIPVRLLLGDEDEYITETKLHQALQEFKCQGYPTEARIFAGRHKIYAPVLQEVFTEMGFITK